METAEQFSRADVAYVEAHFVCLESRPANGPAPSYVLDDGRAFYPPDYFEMETGEKHFKSRLAIACELEGIAPLDADETWTAYMGGIYGVCLNSATPENIARKSALLARIEALIAAPKEDEQAWITALKDAVDALDAIERPFSPHYDRARFGRPPTRDSHITAVRQRFPRITS